VFISLQLQHHKKPPTWIVREDLPLKLKA